MVCTSIHYVKLTFNGTVKYVLTLKSVTFCFHCVIRVYFLRYWFTLVHSIRWSSFVLKKIFPVHLSWPRACIKWYDHFQFLFLRYTKAYETLLWWRRCLKRCVHLGYQMSSNLTVKWEWIFFACVQESPFHGFANWSFNY